MSDLLRNDHDLLLEFTVFLPDNLREDVQSRLQRNINGQNVLNAQAKKCNDGNKENSQQYIKTARLNNTISPLPEV